MPRRTSTSGTYGVCVARAARPGAAGDVARKPPRRGPLLRCPHGRARPLDRVRRQPTGPFGPVRKQMCARSVAQWPEAAHSGCTVCQSPVESPCRTTNTAPDLLPVLSRGRHRNATKGACFMELASFLAGERWSDHPSCTHPLLAELARSVNDYTTDAARPRAGDPDPLGHRPDQQRPEDRRGTRPPGRDGGPADRVRRAPGRAGRRAARLRARDVRLRRPPAHAAARAGSRGARPRAAGREVGPPVQP